MGERTFFRVALVSRVYSLRARTRFGCTPLEYGYRHVPEYEYEKTRHTKTSKLDAPFRLLESNRNPPNNRSTVVENGFRYLAATHAYRLIRAVPDES